MRKNIIIHPWLFALIPIVGLFEHNQDIASLYYLPKPIIISLVSVTALFFVLNHFIKDKYKSAIIVSIFTISFFLFDLLAFLFLEINEALNYGVILYKILALIIYIIIILAISSIIAQSNNNLDKSNKLLNFFAIAVLILQMYSIVSYQYQHRTNNVKNLQINTGPDKYTKINIELDNELPDIYYIILDGYGRADTLSNIYNYDNSAFLTSLEDIGFYIADKSKSNYNQTFLSMSSSLNLKYLDDVAKAAGYKSEDRAILKQTLADNFVYKFLKDKKYIFTPMSSSWSGTYKNIKSDINLSSSLKQNSFDAILINKTPISFFFPNIQIKSLAASTNNIFDTIADIADLDEPSFSYVHILSPHPPFVFEADGSIVNRVMNCMEGTDGSHYFESCPGVEEYKTQYIAQLAYVNTRIKKVVNKIIEKSEVTPIIILQGDHGPGSMLDWESAENSNMQERFPILNAYYVPEQIKKELYPSISPVNSFRVIFNYLFDSQFEILEDKSFFAIWDKPYKFIDVGQSID